MRAELINKHGNKCAICQKPRSHFKKNFAIDHEHKLGTIRGLLCYHDNKYLVGRFDIAKACKLMTYLVEYDNVKKYKAELKALYEFIGDALNEKS